MTNKNPQNEMMKRRYFEFLKHADGKSDATIKLISASITRYEKFTRFKDFKAFDRKTAIGFKEDLQDKTQLATSNSTLTRLKRFFAWLAQHNGYKRSIHLDDIAYLNMTDRDRRTANAPRDKEYPSLAMVKEVVGKMPHTTSIELRNRALIAFTALTMIRVSALASLKIKDFDTRTMLIRQDPRHVHTKNGKAIFTNILPFCDEFEAIILDWVKYLQQELLFSGSDPLFPKTALTHDEDDCFIAKGLLREHWQSSSPIRGIFKTAFEAANLPSYTPHVFRNMMEAELCAIDPSFAEYKAVSQSFGHAKVMTTLTSYGKLSVLEQSKTIRTNLKRRYQEAHN